MKALIFQVTRIVQEEQIRFARKLVGFISPRKELANKGVVPLI